MIGYRRYVSDVALALLRTIYADLRLYINFFQPVMMLVSKERRSSRLHKKYDQARTPYQRALAEKLVSAIDKLRLEHTFWQLNPVTLKVRIDQNLINLWRLHR